MNKIKILLISLSGLSVSACSSTQLVDFSVIQQSNQCHIKSPNIQPLSSAKMQTQFIENYTLFKTPELAQDLTTLFKKHSETEELFVISQGSKSSAGYGFDIQGSQATLNQDTLTLPILFRSPAKGAFSAQVITSPCLVVGIDSSASYQSIKIDNLKVNIPH